MPLLDPTFVASSNPAGGSTATATHAAVAATTGQPAKAHVCQSIHCTLADGTGTAAASAGSIVLRDGLTGAGAILWASGLSVPATVGQSAAPVEISGLAIQGTPGNAMTLEFTAAGGAANVFQTVAFTGFLT